MKAAIYIQRAAVAPKLGVEIGVSRDRDYAVCLPPFVTHQTEPEPDDGIEKRCNRNMRGVAAAFWRTFKTEFKIERGIGGPFSWFSSHLPQLLSIYLPAEPAE